MPPFAATLQRDSSSYKSVLVLRRILAPLLACVVVVSLTGCYAKSAARRSDRIVRDGFDFDMHGPWVMVTAPGSLLLAGGNLAVGSFVPLGGGVDPREPEGKWFAAYEGGMRPAEEVGILCHRERATWITGIRPAGGGEWLKARHEKWHFPVCIEALPGRYELEVQYFSRQHDDDRDKSVSLQAESTEPSLVVWRARAGAVDLLGVRVGARQPARDRAPQRHIPRSRSLGTTWWELEESDWVAQIEPVSDWASLDGPLREQRAAWVRWHGNR
jgi:hypothetical protein